MSSLKKKIKLKKKTINRDLLVSKFTEEINDKIKLLWKNEKTQNPDVDYSRNDQIIHKIGSLIDSLKNVKLNIRRATSSSNRTTLEIKQDVLKRFLEEYTIYAENQKILQEEDTDFNYYPEINDDNFTYKLSLKKEFWKNRTPLIDLKFLEKNKNKSFQLFPHQKFVKNFISMNTPYNGILLWHGVGVGKSCAAISIAENFREFMYYNNKKTLVLTPSNTLIDNWRDEIFNLEKELNNTSNHNVQCTGSRYLNELKDFTKKERHQQVRMVKALINKYYEFMGYQQLYNNIIKDLNNQNKYKRHGIKEIDKINYIKNKFSNRVIIMDEAHVTREGDSSNDSKKIRYYLEMIARYSENTKLILLSATPMYNVTKEIIWLINLLLWNDNMAPLEENSVFNKDGITLVKYDDDDIPWNNPRSVYPPINWIKQSEEINKKYLNLVTGEETNSIPVKESGNMSLQMLTRKSRGYISYLRGDNPFLFPFKMYPETNIYTPRPLLKMKNNAWVPLKEDEIIPNNKMILFRNILSDWQYQNLIKYLENQKLSAFNQSAIQASNIIFPTDVIHKGEFLGKTGDSGWNSCFNINSDGKYELENHVKSLSNGKSFLDIDNIGKFSKKFESIINSIKTCKGIVFIFSQYINHGIKSLAFALEKNGFNRIDSEGNVNNFLKNPSNNKFCANNLKLFNQLDKNEKKNFRQANYIYLDGSTEKSELTKLVRMQRNENNKNGENIKVILGSSVIEQGISFYCVREVHVIDPWHHLNKLEQAVGRAGRSKSHFNLEKSKRNLTLYIHCSSFNDPQKKESMDERIYRKAYFKKKYMSIVERQLKVNSIDCILNRNGNIFLDSNYEHLGENNPLKDINMLDAKGNPVSINLSDIDYSLKCDFDKCEYNCYSKDRLDSNISELINEDTFSEEFARDDIDLSKEYIKVLYLEEVVYDIETILEKINLITDSIDDKFIYQGLHEIVNNKELIYDIYNRRGYLIARNGFYIFQPSNLLDENMPYYYRIKTPDINTKSVSLRKNYNKYLPVKDMKTSKKLTLNKFKKVKKPKAKKNINIQRVIENINSFESYVRRNYSEYNGLSVSGDNIYLPNIEKLIMAKKLYIIERLDFETKKALISDFLVRLISHEKNGTSITKLDTLLLKYYDYKNLEFGSKIPENLSHMILREKRDIFQRLNKPFDSSIDNFPKYFRMTLNNRQLYFQYDEQENDFIPQNTLSENDISKLNLNKQVFKNTHNIYGWVGIPPKKSKEFNFYIVNNTNYVEKHNEDGSVQEKSKRRGGICGHASSCTTIMEIAKTINSALGFNKYIVDKTIKVKLPPKKQPKSNARKSLCEELELILRCKQLDNVGKIPYFYNFEEISIN